MNLTEYQAFYVNDDGHWYVSKIKQFDEANIQVMAQGLALFSDLLSSQPDRAMLARFRRFVPDELQAELFEHKIPQVPIDRYAELFLSLVILADELVTLNHLEQGNPEKFKRFSKIRSEFRKGKNAEFFIKEYGTPYLHRELTVYYRNFFSWLSKFGFLGKQSLSSYCFITDAGKEFVRNKDNNQATSALFRNQIQKVQVWNPTLPPKYSHFEVIPYFAILKVLTKLPDRRFTKLEYVLFITKIESNEADEINDAVNLIKSFRRLSEERRSRYVEDVIELDHKYYPYRTRTNFARLSDSYGKEIYAYTFGGLVSIHDQVIHLTNFDEAVRELAEFENSLGFIEFETKEDWIRHLGSLDGLEIDEIIDVYVRSGRSVEEVKEILRGVEKDIDAKIEGRFLESEVEEYYVQNIAELHPTLEVLKKPRHGRQFQTDIGVIDTLCRDTGTDEFVVVEFKRSQVSDETMGQVLRYMGWVSINMETPGKKVRGIIVGREFSEKLFYSIFGVQEDSFLELLTTHEHPFDMNNRPNI